jgi:hypothetical protein
MAMSRQDEKLLLKLNVDPEELRNTSEERLVISLMVDCDMEAEGRLVAVKFKMYKGHEETIFMSGFHATGLLKFLRQPFDKKRFTDRRREEGDPTPNEPQISNFIIHQPDIEEEQWQGDKKSKTLKAIKSYEFDNAFIFVIVLENDTVHRYIVPDQVSVYMLEYFEELKRLFDEDDNKNEK